METTVEVVLYSKAGCDLCEEMKKAICNSGCAGLYSLAEIDIESDAELFARYQYEIPVLSINGVEAFKHHLQADKFRAYVAALTAGH